MDVSAKRPLVREAHGEKHKGSHTSEEPAGASRRWSAAVLAEELETGGCDVVLGGMRC